MILFNEFESFCGLKYKYIYNSHLYRSTVRTEVGTFQMYGSTFWKELVKSLKQLKV